MIRTLHEARRLAYILVFCFAGHAQTADLIVNHAYLVTMDGSKHIYEDGAVVIKGGWILAVGPSAIGPVIERHVSSTLQAILPCPG